VDFVVKLDTTTTMPHRPDDILEAAKGQGLDAVLIVGRIMDGTTWISASSSDAERLVFLLELAKKHIIDNLQ
jgi:coenzyme F420-reducing hydrogenase delta subunit